MMEENKNNFEERTHTIEEGKHSIEEGKHTIEEGQTSLEEKMDNIEDGKNILQEKNNKMPESEMDFEKINSEETKTEGLDSMTTAPSPSTKYGMKVTDADRFSTRDEELKGRFTKK